MVKTNRFDGHGSFRSKFLSEHTHTHSVATALDGRRKLSVTMRNWEMFCVGRCFMIIWSRMHKIGWTPDIYTGPLRWRTVRKKSSLFKRWSCKHAQTLSCRCRSSPLSHGKLGPLAPHNDLAGRHVARLRRSAAIGVLSEILHNILA